MITHIGMTSDEVLKLYGKPKSISQSVCGSAQVGGHGLVRLGNTGNHLMIMQVLPLAEKRELWLLITLI